MHRTADKVTRLAADLVTSAMAEGERQHRTGRQQLEHWARVGRAVSSQQTAARHRVEEALAGRLPLTELGNEEGTVFNAEIDASIEEQLATANYGTTLAAQGITTVALSDEGQIIEYRPDGTRSVLPE
ncbi:ParD-like family protein [Rhodococcus cerastii]|nr:ParD-like family protein [Rhodococcus cerastii]